MTDKPKPGSTPAINQGCRCPVFDNHRGAGYHGNPNVFVMTEECPIHGTGTQKAIELGDGS